VIRRAPRLVLVVAVLALLAYAGASWLFSEKLVAQQFTSLGPVDFAEYALPQPENETIRGEGVTLSALFFENPRQAECAVVMLHGFSGSKAEVFAPAPIFWPRGCDLLLYDARGHGDSDRALLSFGAHEREDLLRAIEWLAATTDLPRSKIGLIGWSYGAATGIQAASEAGGDVASSSRTRPSRASATSPASRRRSTMAPGRRSSFRARSSSRRCGAASMRVTPLPRTRFGTSAPLCC
jgi:uncharacterized protein